MGNLQPRGIPDNYLTLERFDIRLSVFVFPAIDLRNENRNFIYQTRKRTSKFSMA